MKKIQIILCISLLSLGCSGAHDSNSDYDNDGDTTDQSAIPDCDDTTTEFMTIAPTELSTITSITPLGNINPPAHIFPTDHIYINTTASDQWADTGVPVYFPGDAWITSISSTEYLGDEPWSDYSIDFKFCKEFAAYYYHVDFLTDELLDQINFTDDNCTTSGDDTRTCFQSFELTVEAGTTIGYVYGTYDLGVHDGRIEPLGYADPSNYYIDDEFGIDELHAVCPLDYYTSDLKNSLMALVDREGDPKCGEIEQDEADTLQGNWFIPGTTGYYTDGALRLALVHDNFDPSIGVIAIGDAVGGFAAPDGYEFTHTNSGYINRDFNEVTPDDSIYCYGPFEAWVGWAEGEGETAFATFTVLLQLTSEDTLIIEARDANSCDEGPWGFTDASAEYER